MNDATLVSQSACSWAAGSLRSPHNGRVLFADTAHSLWDGERRWPVIDDIPYLRVGREALAERVLATLDAGDGAKALEELLADRDDWATGVPPETGGLGRIAGSPELTFRAALDALGFGPVATYLAHRWSDPTYVAGLALLATHAPARGATSFEIASGTGPYLRELARCGVAAAGGDVVFSKLWLARRFVSPQARLVCFDAAAAWPFADATFDFTHCHDAFYFFPQKRAVANEMRRVTRSDGSLALSHAHNAAVENHSAGVPLSVRGYAELFPGATFYDDRELAAALIAERSPRSQPEAELQNAAALSFALPSLHGVSRNELTVPADGTHLVRNPLYTSRPTGAVAIRWPSERYEAEYADLATYPAETNAPPGAVMGESEAVAGWARRRELVDLPALW